MAGFTNGKATEILKNAITSTHYIGLSTSEPTDSGTNVTEPEATTGYQRIKLGTLDYSISKQVANQDYLFIFECFSDAGTATHVILSAVGTRGGTIYFSAPLTTPLVMQKGYVPLVRPYKLKIALDKEELETYPNEKDYST